MINYHQLLLFILIALITCLVKSHDGHLLQYEHYLNLTKSIIDNDKYIFETDECNSNRSQLFLAKKQRCINDVHKNYYSLSVVSLPRAFEGQHSKNCDYSAQNFKYHGGCLLFNIDQFNCHHSNKEVNGGSSFDILVRFRETLTVCDVYDHFNNTYVVTCSLEENIENLQIHCMHVSIVLNYEYFDAYSENAINIESLHEIILDDYKVCTRKELSSSASSYFPYSLHHHVNPFIIPPAINIFSASWRLSTYQSDKLLSYEHILSTGSFFQKASRSNLSRALLPNLLIALNNSIISPSLIRIHSTIDSNKNTNTVHTMKLTNNNNYNCIQNNNQNSSRYHFIGSSHLRYIFEAYSAERYGQQLLKQLALRPDQSTTDNMDFDFSPYASYQWEFLLNLCQRRTVEQRNDNLTIILQTGHWDLAAFSLRRIILSKNDSEQFINVVIDILNGNIMCNGLVHIVWVSVVPYPLCANDNIIKCLRGRGYRTNPALSALNEYYLKQLLTRNKNNKEPYKIKLSIVDANQIIFPRLFLREDEEIVCKNHYMCRQQGNKEVLYVTAAGMILMDAIKAAICFK